VEPGLQAPGLLLASSAAKPLAVAVWIGVDRPDQLVSGERPGRKDSGRAGDSLASPFWPGERSYFRFGLCSDCLFLLWQRAGGVTVFLAHRVMRYTE